ASTNDGLRKEIGGGFETAIGRTFATAGEVDWNLSHKKRHDSYVEMTGVLRNKTHGEELPVVWLYPKQDNGRVVVWLGDEGKASLYDTDGSVKPAVLQLVSGGATVLGADLLFQGESLKDGQPVTQTRTVA